MTHAPGPLAGVRVIEFGSTILAPYAGQRLGDLGADVVKIEPFSGDPNRAMARGPHSELSGVALGLHRNKRSIALDLTRADSRAIARRLMIAADVVITNHRVSALERLGLDAGSLRAENPRLVYAEAHSFAVDSGDADRPAYDDTVQALSGLAWLARGSEPAFVPTLLADKVSALGLVEAVLAALVHRDATGDGQRVEVPMFDTTLAFLLVEHLALAAFPDGDAGYSRILTDQRGPHRTADGWVALTPYTDRHWRALYTELGRADLLKGPAHATPATRLREAETVYAELKSLVAAHPTRFWLQTCRRLDIPVAEVPTLAQVIGEPDRSRGAVVELEHPDIGTYRSVAHPARFSESPTSSPPRPAPLIGADGREVLTEMGLRREEIDRLIAGGAVRDGNGSDGADPVR